MTEEVDVLITRFEADTDVLSLVEHPDNPRVGDPEAIAEAIKANGFADPVLVWESNRWVLGGNHTLIACRDILGMPTIPTLWCEPDDDLHALRLLVSLNRAGELAYNDNQRLAAVMQRLVAGDALVGSLYASTDVDVLMRSVTDLSQRSTEAVRRALDSTAPSRTPQERAEEYAASATRSIIVPLSVEDYEETIAALVKIRRETSETNAEVVKRLVLDAAESL